MWLKELANLICKKYWLSSVSTQNKNHIWDWGNTGTKLKMSKDRQLYDYIELDWLSKQFTAKVSYARISVIRDMER